MDLPDRARKLNVLNAVWFAQPVGSLNIYRSQSGRENGTDFGQEWLLSNARWCWPSVALNRNTSRGRVNMVGVEHLNIGLLFVGRAEVILFDAPSTST